MNDFELVDKYYTAMFTEFSDIVTVKEACVMLHMGRKMAVYRTDGKG